MSLSKAETNNVTLTSSPPSSAAAPNVEDGEHRGPTEVRRNPNSFDEVDGHTRHLPILGRIVTIRSRMLPVSLGALFEAASRLTMAPVVSAEIFEIDLGEAAGRVDAGIARQEPSDEIEKFSFEFQGVVNPWRASEIVWSWRGVIAVDGALMGEAAAQPMDRASEPGPPGLSRAIEQLSCGQCEPGAVRVLSWDESAESAIVLALFRPK